MSCEINTALNELKQPVTVGKVLYLRKCRKNGNNIRNQSKQIVPNVVYTRLVNRCHTVYLIDSFPKQPFLVRIILI